METFCVALVVSGFSLVIGIIFIALSRRHGSGNEDVYISSVLREKNETKKKRNTERIQLRVGVISCVFSGLSFLLALFQLLIAVTGNIPAPLIMIGSAQEAGMFEITIERKNYPFGEIYYCVNQGAPVEYEGAFLVFPQDKVTAYITFFNWSSDCEEKTPQSTAITVRTIATLDSDGNIVLQCETPAGDTDVKNIPLYRSDSDDDIRIIDVKGVARLTVSAEELYRLLSSGKELAATVVVRDPDDLRSIVEVKLTENEPNVDVVMQDMVLYLPHREADPNKTVAQRVWDTEAFESDRVKLIPCSVAGDQTIAIPLTSSAKIQIVSRDPGFTDGPFDAEDAVDFVGSHGILHGIGGSNFSPQADITRGAVVTALHNMAGNPLTEAKKDIYRDVPENKWYTKAVAWASEEDIAVGMNGDRFCPDTPVTRGQFALMLWRYSGKPAATSAGLRRYDDLGGVKGDEHTALCWMLQEGILTDADGASIQPREYVSREDAAVMLMRLCGRLVGMDVG